MTQGYIDAREASLAMSDADPSGRRRRRRQRPLCRRLGHRSPARLCRRARPATSSSRRRSISGSRRRPRSAMSDTLDRERREIPRQPGRAGRHGPDRRGQGAGRRARLCEEPVQPRRRRASPAGLGLQAVRLSDRARIRPDAGDGPHRPAGLDQRLEAEELHERVSRPGDAADGAGAVAQHGLGAADGRGRAGNVVRDGAPARHHLAADGDAVDRARHVRGLAPRTDRRLCALRQWRLRRHSRMSSSASPPSTARCSTSAPARGRARSSIRPMSA